MKTPTIVLRGCLKKEHLFMGFFHVKQGSHALLVLNMWYDSRKNEWSMICELRMRETKLEKKRHGLYSNTTPSFLQNFSLSACFPFSRRPHIFLYCFITKMHSMIESFVCIDMNNM